MSRNDQEPVIGASLHSQETTTIAQNDNVKQTEPQPQVIEKVVVEKIIPAAITEDDKAKIFRDRLHELSVKGNAARTNIHQKHLQKIVAYLKQRGYITNDQVEELCGVGNTAAWKLLQELEKTRTIIQLGARGTRVRYRLQEGIQL